ncbi:unnamed protein product [Caenorhabditis bovis]|uniref:Uncharacterized protein n=1 Tax=Caenorhabditis bovis TaxID=2654633 RepID=A0A8S1F256_9PELO|nr:unnamed protein product [Caenorhabditis bovis]
MVSRQPRDSITHVSPKSKAIRKTSAERREKEKVVSRLRQLVGTGDDSTQLELVLAAIAHIRELEAQLNGKENSDLPSDFEQAFASCCTSPCSSTMSSRPTTPRTFWLIVSEPPVMGAAETPSGVHLENGEDICSLRSIRGLPPSKMYVADVCVSVCIWAEGPLDPSRRIASRRAICGNQTPPPASQPAASNCEEGRRHATASGIERAQMFQERFRICMKLAASKNEIPAAGIVETSQQQ